MKVVLTRIDARFAAPRADRQEALADLFDIARSAVGNDAVKIKKSRSSDTPRFLEVKGGEHVDRLRKAMDEAGYRTSYGHGENTVFTVVRTRFTPEDVAANKQYDMRRQQFQHREDALRLLG